MAFRKRGRARKLLWTMSEPVETTREEGRMICGSKAGREACEKSGQMGKNDEVRNGIRALTPTRLRVEVVSVSHQPRSVSLPHLLPLPLIFLPYAPYPRVHPCASTGMGVLFFSSVSSHLWSAHAISPSLQARDHPCASTGMISSSVSRFQVL